MIWAVFAKELRDNFRDRRVLGSALLFPLLGPVIFSVMMTTVASQFADNKPLKIAVSGSAPHLVQFLQRYGAEISDAPADYEKKIQDGDLDVVVSIPKEYADDFSAGRKAELELIADSSQHASANIVRRTRKLLEAYDGGLAALRLLARGVSPELASPIAIDEIDLATPQKTAANLLSIIPLFLLMAAFMGGMHLAIDTTAGERERGSLEALLITPVPRTALALGKWCATLVGSLIAVSVSLLGFAAAVHYAPLQDLGIKASFDMSQLLGVLVTVLPISLFAAAAMMLLATYARSFKEAQTYMTVLNLVPMFPGMIISLVPFKAQTWMMFVPMLSQELLVSRAMRGEASSAAWYAIALVCAIALAAICLAGFARLLRREKIIFGR